VIVPAAPLVAPESVELMELDGIDAVAVPVGGAAAVALVVFLTTVEAIPLPQVLLEPVL
jgi:hypothetical protein